MNYKTAFTATKAGNFRISEDSHSYRDNSMAERNSASQYRMMLQEIDNALMSRYSYLDSVNCHQMASDCPNISEINTKMYMTEHRQFLKQSSGRKNHSLTHSGSKKFMAQHREKTDVGEHDSLVLGKISKMVSETSETRSFQLIPMAIRLIGLLSNPQDKYLAINKLLAAYQDLDERPKSKETFILSHKYALAMIFSNLEVIF